jgi:hypothetical protein
MDTNLQTFRAVKIKGLPIHWDIAVAVVHCSFCNFGLPSNSMQLSCIAFSRSASHSVCGGHNDSYKFKLLDGNRSK